MVARSLTRAHSCIKELATSSSYDHFFEFQRWSLARASNAHLKKKLFVGLLFLQLFVETRNLLASKGQRKATVVCFRSHLRDRRIISVSGKAPRTSTGVLPPITTTAMVPGVFALVTNYICYRFLS